MVGIFHISEIRFIVVSTLYLRLVYYIFFFYVLFYFLGKGFITISLNMIYLYLILSLVNLNLFHLMIANMLTLGKKVFDNYIEGFMFDLVRGHDIKLEVDL